MTGVLKPIFDPKIQYARPRPPAVWLAPASGGLTDGRDTAAGTATRAPIQSTFNCTGVKQTYVVPADVYAVTMTAVGACGYRYNSNPRGRGGSATGTFVVTPGQVLDVYVGCVPTGSRDNTGGWPNGGNGGNGTAAGGPGGAGGGASYVTVESGDVTDSFVVGGGGGGGGTSIFVAGSGAGGHPSGTKGTSGSSGEGGYPGTQTEAGLGGTSVGTAGQPGVADQGGKGGNGTGLLGNGGGGGGGGWFGAGGGAGNGAVSGTGNGHGGGGSSHVAAGGTSVSYQNAINASNGYVTIWY